MLQEAAAKKRQKETLLHSPATSLSPRPATSALALEHFPKDEKDGPHKMDWFWKPRLAASLTLSVSKRKKNIGGTFGSGNAVVVSFFFFLRERGKQRFSCLCSHALLIAATDCTIRLRLLLLLFLLVFVTGVLLGWDPETRLTAGRVLAGKVVVDTAGHG